MPGGVCRACGQRVMYAKRVIGSPMPLDQQNSTGNIRISPSGFAILGKPGSGGYVAHLPACKGRKPGTYTGPKVEHEQGKAGGA